MHSQLPLEFELVNSLTFENFWPGASPDAFDIVSALAEDEGDDRQIYLWGGRHSGKTHLLSAACHRAAKLGMRIAYIPAAQLLSPDAVAGYGSYDLVCIDDLHELAREPACELAVFGLINELRNQEGRLLLAANCAQTDLGTQLPDLYTRLCWGATFSLASVAPTHLHAVLAFRAKAMGLELSVEVLDYLLNRYSRDLESMLTRLSELDRASMQAKRRITIPFVREVFSS